MLAAAGTAARRARRYTRTELWLGSRGSPYSRVWTLRARAACACCAASRAGRTINYRAANILAMLLHPLVAVLASSELESLFHVKPGLTMPQAFRQMAGGFTGRTEEERIAAWWYLQDIAGSSARFANGVSSGSDVKMKWLNETVNMATFGDRVDLFGFMGRVQGKQQKPTIKR